MATYSQANRPLKIHTPLGDDAVLIARLQGTEAISELFHFELELLAEKTVAFDQLLGQAVTVEVTQANGKPRYVHGIVTKLTQDGKVHGSEGKPTMLRYQAEIMPQAWWLSRNCQSRIFQHQTVVDILKAVFTGLDVSYRLVGIYPERNYCVQYRESDWAFASRLMEEEGIYYFFEYRPGGHTLVVADAARYPKLSGIQGPENLVFNEADEGVRHGDSITVWRKTQELRPGKFAFADHHFQLPNSRLGADAAVTATTNVGQVAHPLALGDAKNVEIYDHTSGYGKYFDDVNKSGSDQGGTVQKTFTENQRLARLRMEQEQAQCLRVTGVSDCVALTPGYTFHLQRHLDGDGGYLLTRVAHDVSVEETFASTSNVPSLRNEHRFVCIPEGVSYRPPLVTPRPKTEGPLTAKVVGPAGEEIFCDKYGRVKVQFYWDRDGQSDVNSSCWLRVAQTWAGTGFGSLCIPRVGQDVIVEFIEGDPDRPLVVGSVYNANNMPPYSLPSEATHQGFKTRSRNGSAANANELRFEDTLGQEAVHIHAEKDLFHTAENSFHIKVGSSSGSGGGGGESGDSGGTDESIFSIEVPKMVSVVLGQSSEWIGGLNDEIIVGGSAEIVAGLFNTELVLAAFNFEMIVAPNTEILIGPQIEVVVGDYLETVTGDFVEIVTGNFTEMVFGSFEEVVTGDFIETVTGDFIEVVTGEFYERIGGTFTEIVVGTFTEILLADFYEMREGEYIECNESHDHAIETTKSEKVSVGWNVSAGASITLTTLGKVTIIGLEEISIVCGGSSIKLGPEGVTIKGLLIKQQAAVQHQVEAVQIQAISSAQCVQDHPLLQDS